MNFEFEVFLVCQALTPSDSLRWHWIIPAGVSVIVVPEVPLAVPGLAFERSVAIASAQVMRLCSGSVQL